MLAAVLSLGLASPVQASADSSTVTVSAPQYAALGSSFDVTFKVTTDTAGPFQAQLYSTGYDYGNAVGVPRYVTNSLVSGTCVPPSDMINASYSCQVPAGTSTIVLSVVVGGNAADQWEIWGDGAMGTSMPSDIPRNSPTTLEKLENGSADISGLPSSLSPKSTQVSLSGQVFMPSSGSLTATVSGPSVGIDEMSLVDSQEGASATYPNQCTMTTAAYVLPVTWNCLMFTGAQSVTFNIGWSTGTPLSQVSITLRVDADNALNADPSSASERTVVHFATAATGPTTSGGQGQQQGSAGASASGHSSAPHAAGQAGTSGTSGSADAGAAATTAGASALAPAGTPGATGSTQAAAASAGSTASAAASADPLPPTADAHPKPGSGSGPVLPIAIGILLAAALGGWLVRRRRSPGTGV
jgi:hypothetical protein